MAMVYEMRKILGSLLLMGSACVMVLVGAGCSDNDDGGKGVSGEYPYVEEYCERWLECDPEHAPFQTVEHCIIAMNHSITEQIEESGPECGTAYEAMMKCFSEETCEQITTTLVCMDELSVVTEHCDDVIE